MSSPAKPGVVDSATAAAFASALKPSAPVDILPTDAARLVAHVHPVLLLSVYYLRFSALVADPVQTLLTALGPLTAVQIAYVVLCLPPAGSTGKTSKKTPKAKPGSKTKAVDTQPSVAVTVFLALLLSLVSVPVLTAIQILFGAPLTTHLPHTILSSTHIALLTVFPLVYVHGVTGAKWVEIVSAAAPVDEVFGGLVGCCLGAWVGAVPIPLDWDREWQKWPITIISGAYAGYVLGKVLGGSLLKGKRIEFD